MDSEIIIRVISEDGDGLGEGNLLDAKSDKMQRATDPSNSIKGRLSSKKKEEKDKIEAFAKQMGLALAKKVKTDVFSFASATTDSYVEKRAVNNANALLDVGADIVSVGITASISPALAGLQLASTIFNKITSVVQTQINNNLNVSTQNATIRFNNQRSGSETNL